MQSITRLIIIGCFLVLNVSSVALATSASSGQADLTPSSGSVLAPAVQLPDGAPIPEAFSRPPPMWSPSPIFWGILAFLLVVSGPLFWRYRSLYS